MKLYYGSKEDIRLPIYGLGNPTNDYGLGFYMTDDKAMAELWASKNNDGGYVISYSLDTASLRILRLTDNTELSLLKWITLLVKHRFPYQDRLAYKTTIDWLMKHFDSPIDDYDMVIGYRADDSYFSYSVGFVAGEISLETLLEAMLVGKLGLQYVLVSKRAFKQIHYLESYPIPHHDGYSCFRAKTLEEYHLLLAKENRFNNTFIGDLMKKYGE